MRQAGILLVLAAVFSMHGLSSLPGYPGAAGEHVASYSAMGVDSDGMVLGPASMAAGVAEPMDGSVTTDHEDGPGHGMSAHLWSLCLAILIAGAAVVGLVLIAQAPPVERLLAGVGRVRRPAELVPILRPPDLSVLCLWRI